MSGSMERRVLEDIYIEPHDIGTDSHHLRASPFLPELKLRAAPQRQLKLAFSPIHGALLCSPATLAPGRGQVG